MVREYSLSGLQPSARPTGQKRFPVVLLVSTAEAPELVPESLALLPPGLPGWPRPATLCQKPLGRTCRRTADPASACLSRRERIVQGRAWSRGWRPGGLCPESDPGRLQPGVPEPRHQLRPCTGAPDPGGAGKSAVVAQQVFEQEVQAPSADARGRRDCTGSGQCHTG